MSDQAARIAGLSPEQRDFLMRRMAQKRPVQAPAGKPVPHPQDALEAPLSFAQERMWFRNLLVPGDSAHNLAGALRLRGALSLPALQRAFDEVIRRHEALRTNVAVREGEPRQRIHPPRALPLEPVNLAGLSRDARDAECRRRYREETLRGFDLEKDRLLRVQLLRLEEDEHLLLLTLHHLIADGWSIGVLLREVAAIYAAPNGDAALPPLPWQYRDYACWQRDRKQEANDRRSLDYWKQQLAQLPPLLRLRPDRPAEERPPEQGAPEGITTCATIEAGLLREIDALARQEGATRFAVLLTAFFVLLRRCTGEEDLLIGSPVSGRTRLELEPLIGLFINTVALRVRLPEGLEFRAALGAVQETVLAALEHHETPFERVVQEAAADRRAARQPLFDILFNYTPTPSRVLELPGLQARFEDPPGQGAEFSLQLFVVEREGGLDLQVLHSVQTYQPARMRDFLEQMRAVLGHAVRAPDTALPAFDLVTERARLLLPDPTAAMGVAAPDSILRRIHERILESPHAPAIQEGGRTLTFVQAGAAIVARAEQLRVAGIKPRDVVAVFGPRSAGVVISAAGVLLAGGVLLLLSPDMPAARRRVMLQEAQARHAIIVGEPAVAQEFAGCTPIFADAPRAGAALDPQVVADAFAEYLPRLTDAAYLFFTSGSTGKPKGVLGAHAGLAHFLDWQRRTFAVGPGDRCAHLTGLSFDVVLRDIFLPLTAGATLVVPDTAVFDAPEAMLRWLEREVITLVHTVPSLAETWLLQPPPEVTLKALQRIFFAGEPLTSTLIARWRAAFPGAGEIINLYGPTETTLAKCFFRVPAAPTAGIQPLGRAMPGSQALVLSSARRLCGIGEPGEIAIRTPFRSLGYFNAPEENKARFVPNPHTRDDHDLIYLTGDRGVWTPEGLLEFLGRLDDQVKIRGVRVEPAEVAAVLRAAPGVAGCAVVPREHPAQGLMLVAYVAMETEAERDAAALRHHLRELLPAPMHPAAFVFLDRLPLTPNHKLDRRRLPEPCWEEAADGRHVPPRNAPEAQLARIWEQLLPGRSIGVTDDFFALGGHSLMIFRLLLKTEEATGVRVSIAAFLEQPTVERLAVLVERGAAAERTVLVELRPGEHRHRLFLVHPGGGGALNYVPLARHLAAPVRIFGLQPRGLDRDEAPTERIEDMAAEYLAAIRRIQPSGPYLLAGHSLGGVIAFEMAKQLENTGQSVALLAMFDSARPDIAQETVPEFDTDAALLARMVDVVARFAGRQLSVSAARLAQLTTAEQIREVCRVTAGCGYFDGPGGEPLVQRMLHLSRAHLAARRAYRPGRVRTAICFFQAEQSANADGLSWARLSAGDVQLKPVPGDHVTMMTEPQVQVLARELERALAAASLP